LWNQWTSWSTDMPNVIQPQIVKNHHRPIRLAQFKI
jgi:hypothetical protein